MYIYIYIKILAPSPLSLFLRPSLSSALALEGPSTVLYRG